MVEGSFSRPIVVDQLPLGEATEIVVSADSAERRELARRLALPDIASFEATFSLLRRAGDRVKVDGEARARVTRVCVVSLEPFETDLVESYSVDFAPDDEVRAAAAREAHAPPPGQSIVDLPDPPDPIVDGQIDLGALSVEFLSLGLDPYPRKPGVDFQPPDAARQPGDSPFAALARLPRKRE